MPRLDLAHPRPTLHNSEALSASPSPSSALPLSLPKRATSAGQGSKVRGGRRGWGLAFPGLRKIRSARYKRSSSDIPWESRGCKKDRARREGDDAVHETQRVQATYMQLECVGIEQQLSNPGNSVAVHAQTCKYVATTQPRCTQQHHGPLFVCVSVRIRDLLTDTIPSASSSSQDFCGYAASFELSRRESFLVWDSEVCGVCGAWGRRRAGVAGHALQALEPPRFSGRTSGARGEPGAQGHAEAAGQSAGDLVRPGQVAAAWRRSTCRGRLAFLVLLICHAHSRHCLALNS